MKINDGEWWCLMTTRILLNSSMDIYLVRHGQTNGNLAARHQHPNTPLNAEGEQGATQLAKQLVVFKPTHIVTSYQRRALETAQIIAKELNLVPQDSELFAELNRPQYFVGERRTGWATLKYMALWYLGYAPASHHDGETYEALRQRIKEAKALVAELPPDARVIIISHSAFITFFIAHLTSDRPVGLLRAVSLLFKMLLMRNTTYTHISYNNKTWHSH